MEGPGRTEAFCVGASAIEELVSHSPIAASRAEQFGAEGAPLFRQFPDDLAAARVRADDFEDALVAQRQRGPPGLLQSQFLCVQLAYLSGFSMPRKMSAGRGYTRGAKGRVHDEPSAAAGVVALMA
jgi:hypothetical protein